MASTDNGFSSKEMGWTFEKALLGFKLQGNDLRNDQGKYSHTLLSLYSVLPLGSTTYNPRWTQPVQDRIQYGTNLCAVFVEGIHARNTHPM